ncbi:MAG: alpha/beta hydrolase-fold protein, partial [Roseimicrobium sp.]
MHCSILLLCFLSTLSAAEPEFPLTEDSKPKPAVPKGELIKGTYTAKDGSVFPGTQREYQIYLPYSYNFTKAARWPFMVFQDGVIYNAPTVFDNLIAKHELPPLVGIFVKPGVVPAAKDNALPRYNRSYEYDSVTDTYARFLIEELLPALEQRHGLKLSTDPNDAAISGNSSGGIAAFMVAWHRPDRFRRVFTGVGTYVGIHGADQLPVLVRKVEPKPLKVFLQSGTGDNNLYCGDWWMANQMMERSLTWAGYDVNHAWGEGGHNQKHASQIFPDVLRWLWKGWPEAKEVKANPRGESKWLGYPIIGEAKWETALTLNLTLPLSGPCAIAADKTGRVFASTAYGGEIHIIDSDGRSALFANGLESISCLAATANGSLIACANTFEGGIYHAEIGNDGKVISKEPRGTNGVAISHDGKIFMATETQIFFRSRDGKLEQALRNTAPPESHTPIDPFGGNQGRPILPALHFFDYMPTTRAMALSPDQTSLYVTTWGSLDVAVFQVGSGGLLGLGQKYYQLEVPENCLPSVGGLCVDTEGRLYVATVLGIQVCDQAGRVNFIIPTPQQ